MHIHRIEHPDSLHVGSHDHVGVVEFETQFGQHPCSHVRGLHVDVERLRQAQTVELHRNRLRDARREGQR